MKEINGDVFLYDRKLLADLSLCAWEVFLNTSKYFITGSENTPRLIIVLLLTSKREHVKLNWVSTCLGKDQGETWESQVPSLFSFQKSPLGFELN